MLDSLRGRFSDEFIDRFQILTHLMSLMDNYAKASGSILLRLQESDNPYDINDGEVLLAITASRNVLRLVEKGRKELGQTGTLYDAFDECVQTFKAANSDLISARNVIEHADEYIVGAGRSPEDWFDIERCYESGSFIFTIGKREINLTNLAVTTAVLSADSMNLFKQWLTLDATFDFWRVFLSPLTDLGHTVRVPFKDFSDVTPFVSFDELPRDDFTLTLEIYDTRAEAEAVSGTALTVTAGFDVVEE
ncbi:hypothetical protein E3T26_09295 [Cryobacterium sp. TMT1-21]|uniref:hypothetical protein n=1 Tax=Cryobacterium sp. TMT1-21 TaxID=1259234 RepID=UPI00106CE763|nr:hypothetical protein [Cryobacterium sp. TMT1-21]TFD13793.1 hypothetical protein E3T26_09295 [Cryobacterium sp. TMT1-21]